MEKEEKEEVDIRMEIVASLLSLSRLIVFQLPKLRDLHHALRWQDQHNSTLQHGCDAMIIRPSVKQVGVWRTKYNMNNGHNRRNVGKVTATFFSTHITRPQYIPHRGWQEIQHVLNRNRSRSRGRRRNNFKRRRRYNQLKCHYSCACVFLSCREKKISHGHRHRCRWMYVGECMCVGGSIKQINAMQCGEAVVNNKWSQQ